MGFVKVDAPPPPEPCCSSTSARAIGSVGSTVRCDTCGTLWNVYRDIALVVPSCIAPGCTYPNGHGGDHNIEHSDADESNGRWDFLITVGLILAIVAVASFIFMRADQPRRRVACIIRIDDNGRFYESIDGGPYREVTPMDIDARTDCRP